MPGSTVCTKPGSRDGKTLALAAELRTLGLTVIAYPELTQVLHIVHIQPHHMAQSMGIKQGMRPFAHGIFGIAFINPSSFSPSTITWAESSYTFI